MTNPNLCFDSQIKSIVLHFLRSVVQITLLHLYFFIMSLYRLFLYLFCANCYLICLYAFVIVFAFVCLTSHLPLPICLMVLHYYMIVFWPVYHCTICLCLIFILHMTLCMAKRELHLFTLSISLCLT